MSLAASLNDLCEVGLQRCPSNEEAIDIWLFDKLIAVVRAHAATILNAHLVGDCISALCAQVLSNGCLCVLCLLWCSNLTGAYGPNWLVCNDELIPIPDLWNHCIQLLLVHLVCDARLPLLQGLSDAEENPEICLLCLLHLGCRVSQCLTILCSSLGVSDKSPAVPALHCHFSCPLTSERADASFREVLSAHLDTAVGEGINDSATVQSRWANHPFTLRGVELEVLECVTKLCHLSHTCWVALPIATHNLPPS
mmetsp:Transcript_18270/g.42594  ORF Transcript_18270/g.42594 Transcript_18270/m.42594 type:complete len:253 (-) Transcript_18270:1343-2101(-)